MHKHKLIMIQKLLYSVMFARNSGKNVELFPKVNSDVSKAFYLDSAKKLIRLLSWEDYGNVKMFPVEKLCTLLSSLQN